jgi:tetratricopeptide (TPR) repeat protein
MSSSPTAGGISMGGGGNHFGSPHSDVLGVVVNATSTANQKETLYLELQRRSKAAVKANQWYDAVSLYTKAIECCSTSPEIGSNEQHFQHQLPATKATLYANISLCLGKMNRWTEAVTNAQQSVEIDPTYVKGWYRLGQAHASVKECNEAMNAFGKALVIDPKNTVLAKELEKAKTALELQQKQQEEKEKNGEAEDAATISTTTISSTKVTNTKPPNSKPSNDDVEMTYKDSNKNDNDDSNNDEFTKSDHIKGYKIVNGKKTSYFHNELSEDVAKLIGDIAPKKLDPVVSDIASATTTVEQGTSAWNKAGTWEEKDCSVWATDTITEQLIKLTYTLPSSSPAPNAVLSISKVVLDKSSHASVATVRGKKRYLYELDITIHWNFIHEALSASGTIRFPDIDGTCTLGDGYDATEYTVIQIDDPTLQPVLKQFCYQQGLRLLIHETIDNWVRLFKDTY